MDNWGLMGVRLALIVYIACVMVSHSKLYERLKHICIFRIMGKIGGASYDGKTF